MSFYAESDYDPDAPVSDEAAADALRHRAATDYMAAREALKRIQLVPELVRDLMF